MTRALTFLFFAWISLILMATMQAVIPISWACRFAAPDILFLVILFFGLQARGSLVSACAFGVAAGYLGDLFHGAPKGLYMLACGLAVLVVRLASTRLLVRGHFATLSVAFVFSLGFSVLIVALRAWFEAVGFTALRHVPVAALATAIAAPLVFRLLARIDRRFARDPRELRPGAVA